MADRNAKRGMPAETSERRGLRGGGPTMQVPGDGNVTKPLGTLDGNSAAHHADVMDGFLGGPSGGVVKYGEKK